MMKKRNQKRKVKIPMSKVLLHILTLCYILIIFSAPLFADKKTDLPGTQITIPWDDFEKLSSQKVDTVKIIPPVDVPVPIIFDDINIQIILNDSNVECSYNLHYVNMSNREWSTKNLISEHNDFRFTSVICPKGDFLQYSNDGYKLISKKNINKSRRLLIGQWQMNAELSRGYREIKFPFPQVSKGSITIKAPFDYTDINLENSVLLSKNRKGNYKYYKFTLPSYTSDAKIKYAPPVPEIIDSSKVKVDRAKVKKSSKVTSFNETAIFTAEDNTFVISTINLNVAHAPITSFTIKKPANYTLLKIEGNGIKKWSYIDSTEIEIKLTFELEGKYSLLLIGESKKSDILHAVPTFTVPIAMRESGIFAIAVEGNGEGQFEELRNAVSTPVSQYLKKLSPLMQKSFNKFNKRSDDIILSGINYKAPYSATYTIKRHKLINVASAISDSGTLITAITEDGKLLHQASYLIKQRNKQFISLKLPDSCDLWSVKINGNDVAPFIDNDGGLRVSLQRYTGLNNATSLNLSLTYFKKIENLKNNKKVILNAPIPDIPVNVFK